MSFPRRVDAVVFDMDGLLLDTEIVYRAAMIEAGNVFGVQFTGETYASMVGKTTPECGVMLRELYTRLPDIRTDGEPDRLLSGFINGYKRLPCTFTAPVR